MIIYKIALYNSKSRKTTIIAEMPERRMSSKRLKGKLAVVNWLKHVFGEEWYSTYKNFVGISEHEVRK